MKMTLWILWVLLTVRCEISLAFSTGAPLSSCEGDMIPRHGFEAQVCDPPVEIVMDEYTIVSDQYLRVTIRSKRSFRGFLIRAESDTGQHLGVWYIPYLEDTSYLSESSYLHCGGRTQSAVTHSGRTNTMFVISFQWKPPADFHGWVSFHATVVENYRVFWLDVSSAPLYVMPEGDAVKDTPEYYEVSKQVTSNKRTSYYNVDHRSTHKYDMVKNNKLLPREESTVSSIFRNNESDSTDSDLFNTPVDFIDFGESDDNLDNLDGYLKPINYHTLAVSNRPLKVTPGILLQPKGTEKIPVSTKAAYALPSSTKATSLDKEEMITVTSNGLLSSETTFSTTETTPQAMEEETTVKLPNEILSTTSQRNPRPRILEPTFVFTTDSPTRTSRDISMAVSSTQQQTLDSHFFLLEEDFDLENDKPEGELQSEIVGSDRDIDIEGSRLNTSNLDTFLYYVEHNKESTSANTEDLKEDSFIRNNTELERMPRDNDGTLEEEFETLEGPYQRIKAQYGSWENESSNNYFSIYCIVIILLNICM